MTMELKNQKCQACSGNTPEGHHPDISLGWGYTLIMLHTHAIQGLSINDFIIAAKIDEIT